MAYRGFSGGGFVGNHLTTALLEALRPAADNAGRHATVGDPSTRAAPYTSDGESWKSVPLVSADGTSLVSGDGTRLYVVPLYDLPAPSAMSGTSEVVLAQFSIAAGLMGVLDRLEMRLSASKSGTSETATIRVRVGTLGTTADTVVYTSPSLLVSTNVSAGTLLDFKRSSETALQKLGSGVSTGAYGGASTVAYPAAVTVGDMDDAAYFVSVTAASSSTSETITLQDLIARLTTAA